MDKKILLLVLVVLTSGCTDLQGTSSSDSSVQIVDFSVNDHTLYTEQEAVVSLLIENYNTEAEITELRLVNAGALEVEDGNWQDKCSSASLPKPENGRPGLMECSWTIKAPAESELGNFNSKSYSPQLMLRYSSKLSNSKNPVRLHMKPSQDIQSTQSSSPTFSNGEVKTSVSLENPVPLEIETPVTVNIQANTNHMVSETYGFEISPASIIESCDGQEPVNDQLRIEVEPDQTGNARFNCVISPDTETTRNLILSTSYKYQKAPSLSVEVVSN